MSTSIASGLTGAAAFSASFFPPSGPVLAATNPVGARAALSSAAIASTSPSSAAPSADSAACCPRATACAAMKLTSVLPYR
jgi:hypothetical protein